MVNEKMFEQVLESIKKGERSRAKDLLTRVLQADKQDPEPWLWMSSVVDSRKEQTYCLETVLRLDPENEGAKRALILLGEMGPGEVKPVPPIRREWTEDLTEIELESKKERSPSRIPKNLIYIGGGMLLLILILGAIFIPSGSGIGILKPQRSVTPITWTPTVTRPTSTPTIGPSLTPVEPGERSLEANLEATYTPTPIYVNTPHPRYEAYRTAMRAYQNEDYQKMLTFMKQVAEQDETADAYYYVGESYRFLGKYAQAIQQYNKALQANSLFAPAYLGRARVQLAQNLYAKVLDDLTKSVENDPEYGEAYLERAAYWLRWRQPEEALEDAQKAELLLPDSPYPYLYQAQALLDLGKKENVLSLAKKAQSLDVTLVDTYLVLGQIYIAEGDTEKAIENLEIYDTYATEKPLDYSVAIGKAYYFVEKYEESVEILSEALRRNGELIDALIYRGLSYIELEEYQLAILDTYNARELAPEVFETGFALGKAFFAAEEYRKAEFQFETQEDRVDNDHQLAKVYYWRALTLEKMGEPFQAKEVWQALLDLPEEVVPEEWRVEAEERLLPTETPTNTPSPTNSPTNTPEATITPSPSTTPTATPNLTSTTTPRTTTTPHNTPTPTPNYPWP